MKIWKVWNLWIICLIFFLIQGFGQQARSNDAQESEEENNVVADEDSQRSLHVSMSPIATTKFRLWFIVIQIDTVVLVKCVEYGVVKSAGQQEQHIRNHQNRITGHGHITLHTNAAAPAKGDHDCKYTGRIVAPIAQTKAHYDDRKDDDQNIGGTDQRHMDPRGGGHFFSPRVSVWRGIF